MYWVMVGCACEAFCACCARCVILDSGDKDEGPETLTEAVRGAETLIIEEAVEEEAVEEAGTASIHISCCASCLVSCCLVSCCECRSLLAGRTKNREDAPEKS